MNIFLPDNLWLSKLFYDLMIAPRNNFKNHGFEFLVPESFYVTQTFSHFWLDFFGFSST
jgi:hypothetical protein